VHYDPLLAKLVVWGETREAAINRLSRALDEYAIEGIKTSLPFFRALARDEEFRRGEFDTGFIERFLQGGRKASFAAADTSRDIAAIAAVLHSRTSVAKVEGPSTAGKESGWKMSGRTALRRR
jgi:acetyl/propionyl-CoA carboxylase alpha subunit